MAGKSKTVPAFGLSRIVAADSSIIREGKIGQLPPGEFEMLKGLGYVREPTDDEIKAADEPVFTKVEEGAFDPTSPVVTGFVPGVVLDVPAGEGGKAEPSAP